MRIFRKWRSTFKIDGGVKKSYVKVFKNSAIYSAPTNSKMVIVNYLIGSSNQGAHSGIIRRYGIFASKEGHFVGIASYP